MEYFIKIVTKADNLPIVLMLFLCILYTWHAMRRALRNDKLETTLKKQQNDKITVWPHLVRVEFLASVVSMIILTVWSFGIDAPLEEPANPAITPNPSKAPWYFLGLQELLVYFDPWIAGVVLPTIIIIGLMSIPYIDINEKGNGYYTFKERPFAILTFSFGFLIMWVSLIVLGTFLRGPGWNFFWPWQYWDHDKVVALNNVDWSEFFGIPTRNVDNSLNIWAMLFGAGALFGYFGLSIYGCYLWVSRKRPDVFKKMGPVRFGVTVTFFVMMVGVILKMILRWTFNIKYVWVTPWFNV